ncbi:MAG: molybdopterin-dependent oxidoreductase, partial [Gaiellaceae bacterium]
SAVLPEETGDALDAFRLPLSAIGDAELVVVVGNDPVVERAPIVDLWIRAARRRGAEVVTIGPDGSVQAPPGSAARTCGELAAPGSELGSRLREAARAILIWSGSGGHGGAQIAALAAQLGFSSKPGSGAFHLPATPNGRGVAEAWAAAADADEESPEPISLLIVSGDEAAADPHVRALAERADTVLAIVMFQGLTVGWADLVLPGTSYLERDGTMMNLEGRLQRLRRTVIPPAPDELAWTARLAERFGVELSPHPAEVFAELSATLFGGLPFGEVGERAPLRVRSDAEPAVLEQPPAPAKPSDGHYLHLLRYRPLFSGAAVERVPELQFQRPPAEVELAYDDGRRRGITTGDEVTVRSNGFSATLSARLNRSLSPGVARIADEHARELHAKVEVTKA